MYPGTTDCGAALNAFVKNPVSMMTRPKLARMWMMPKRMAFGRHLHVSSDPFRRHHRKSFSQTYIFACHCQVRPIMVSCNRMSLSSLDDEVEEMTWGGYLRH